MNKHIIFTSGRSGSNYLSNTLNLSSECVNYGEVLGEWTVPHKFVYTKLFKGENVGGYLELVYSSDIIFYLGQLYSCFSHLKAGRKVNFKWKNKVSSVGIKDFLVTMEGNDGSFQYIMDNPEIKIIYLYRENILNRYISVIYLGETKQSVSYEGNKNHKVFIELDDFFNKMEIYESERNREEAFLEGLPDHDILRIEYEDYFKDTDSINTWNKRVFEFLGLRPISAFSQQKKIMSKSLEDNISNYDELLSAVKGTEYEKYLN
ncbi:MAG: sulfotransferase domain-containing protein [Gammaproteobacteria bacterium]